MSWRNLKGGLESNFGVSGGFFMSGDRESWVAFIMPSSIDIFSCKTKRRGQKSRKTIFPQWYNLLVTFGIIVRIQIVGDGLFLRLGKEVCGQCGVLCVGLRLALIRAIWPESTNLYWFYCHSPRFGFPSNVLTIFVVAKTVEVDFVILACSFLLTFFATCSVKEDALIDKAKVREKQKIKKHFHSVRLTT